jgi:hypothetical protein
LRREISAVPWSTAPNILGLFRGIHDEAPIDLFF